MKSFVRAYLDDYHSITVVINKNFCGGKSDVFYLVDQSELYACQIKDMEEDHDKMIYHVTFREDIVIGNEYEVMIVNACRINLEYRFIVKTDRFNEEFYYDGDDLGCSIVDKKTTFALWAPTAREVMIELEHNGLVKNLKLHRGNNGVWRIAIAPAAAGALYRYVVRVNGEWSYCNDPYGKASIANGEKNVVIDTDILKTEKINMEKLDKYSDAVIYEACIRDLSNEGTFVGAIGQLDYLQDLGITHLQLMPVNDFGSVDELHPELFYNWGYDPVQYQALEGSYSSNINNTSRVISDFAQLVNEAHKRGIKINLDVVFNHVYVVEASSFSLSVPYYFFRYHSNGSLSDGNGCGNEIDTHMPMARKFIIDTLKYYVDQFDVDGFRFDLMGLIDIKTMREVSDQLKEFKADLMLYGEGWNMHSSLPDEERSSKDNHKALPEIAFFNDCFRDIFKGSTFDACGKGYGTGNFELIDNAIEALKGQLLVSPEQSINYIECHDDMTCFDKLSICCGYEEKESIIRRQKFLLGCVLIAQGIPFIHAGQEYCRSKNGIASSYNAPDSVNKLKEADKETYSQVVNYVKKLIRLRKSLRLAKTKDEILHHVTLGKQDNCIVYELRDWIAGRTTTILLNPTEEYVEYAFEGSRTEVFESNLVHNNRLLLSPISITILESED